MQLTVYQNRVINVTEGAADWILKVHLMVYDMLTKVTDDICNKDAAGVAPKYGI